MAIGIYRSALSFSWSTILPCLAWTCSGSSKNWNLMGFLCISSAIHVQLREHHPTSRIVQFGFQNVSGLWTFEAQTAWFVITVPVRNFKKPPLNLEFAAPHALFPPPWIVGEFQEPKIWVLLIRILRKIPTILVEIPWTAAQKSTKIQMNSTKMMTCLLVESLRELYFSALVPYLSLSFHHVSADFAENSRGPRDDHRRRAASPGGFRQPWQPWQGWRHWGRWGRWGRWGNGTSWAVPNFLGDAPTNDAGQTWANYTLWLWLT